MANILFAIEIPEFGAIDIDVGNTLAATESLDTAEIFTGNTVTVTESQDTASFTLQWNRFNIEVTDPEETGAVNVLTGEIVTVGAVEEQDTASITTKEQTIASFSVTESRDRGAFDITLTPALVNTTATITAIELLDVPAIEITQGTVTPSMTLTVTALEKLDTSDISALQGFVGQVAGVEEKDTAAITVSPNNFATVVGVEAGDTAYIFISQSITTPVRRTIVMNISNYAVSDYVNLSFNSMAQFNGELLAANENGVYLAGGNTDLGTPIEAEMTSGVIDLSDKQVKAPIEAWTAGRADSLDLTVRADESTTTYDYPFVHFQREGRAKIGKGLKGRFFTFGVKNKSGLGFDMKYLKVLGQIIARKTR